MIHEILPVGLLGCNCSILGDRPGGSAIVVDPGDDLTRIQAILDQHQLTVQAIVITHAHIDHIGGAAKLKAITGAPVFLRQEDQFLYDQLDWQARWLGMPTPERTNVDVSPREGDHVTAGGLDLEWIHTPGHTPGSSSLWMPAANTLIAGDTLFRDSIGRTDLPGGDGRLILRSIRDKLLPLPDTATVIPGHGASTTLAREREYNPFLQGL